MLTYANFKDLLPSPSEVLPLVEEAPEGAQLPDALPEAIFVAPQLEVMQEVADGLRPQVLLVCAAAAVGKTTMARQLARSTRNPYWDLGQFVLGSGFFAGTVAGSYGVPRYAEVIDLLRNGKACLILDAADEAVVGSTTLSFRAALDNLADVLRGASGLKPSVVMFGRHETIFDAAERLEKLDIPAAIFEVSYFDEAAALEFVRVRARAAAESSLLPEFDQFVDRFNRRVMEALEAKSWAEVESFLGYAPVLESLALFYAQSPNPHRQLSDFLDGDEKHVWRLLADMLNEVLCRESEKFASNFGGGSTAKAAFGRSAYSPDFQTRLLLSANPQSISADAEMGEDTDPDWLTDLDERIQVQLTEHPFVKSLTGAHSKNYLEGFASVAFRDYVLARTITAGDESHVEEIVGYWSSPRIVPSIILSRFLFDLAGGSEIPASSLPLVVDSHSMSARTGAPKLLWLRWDTRAPEDVSRILLSTQNVGQEDSVELSVTLHEGSSVVLGRRLANSVLFVPGLPVVLGEAAAESVLGPNAFLWCQSFGVRSSEMRVFSVAKRPNIVSARQVEGFLRSIVGSPESLQLRVPPVAFPWQKYRVERVPTQSIEEGDLLSLGLQVRGLVARFSRGSMLFPVPAMHTILAKGRIAQDVFDYFVHRDYIWRDGDVYRMTLPAPLDVVQRVDVTRPELRSLLTDLFSSLNRGGS